MNKFFGFLLFLSVVNPGTVISTENDVTLTEEQIYSLTSSDYGEFYTDIPSHPVSLQDLVTFKDEQLKIAIGSIKKDTLLTINSFRINKDGVPIFVLSNGQFVRADKKFIFQDSILNKVFVHQKKWLKKDFTIFESPYVVGVKPKKTNLSAYTSVIVSQIVQTPHGQYALVNDQGWVNTDYLDDEDNRMQQVQELLSSKYDKSDYGIYVKNLVTNQEAGINADKNFYSASVSKLPYLYYIEKEIDSGKLDPNKPLKYIAEVNSYPGSYVPEGSGSLPKTADGKEYTVADLMRHVAKESDNVAHNILGYYLTNKSNQTFKNTINELAGREWNVKSRDISSRMVGNILTAIYQQNSNLVDILSQTDFDNQRISKNISVKVAHKIGDAYEYRHDAAIVYGNTPFILVIFTNHSSYDTITQMADDIYGVLK